MKPVTSLGLQSFNTEPCEKQGTGSVSPLKIGRTSKLITSFATGCLCTYDELYGNFASVSGVE